MSFFAILETLLIGPLKLVFEIIFDISNRVIGHPGLAIVMLSMAMNVLVLPLYRRADAMQEAARDTEERLRAGVTHIKKTFSGDERMMILQTYYRQNNYKPLSALNGSVSLLLEIPFFLAAYQFLAHLEVLQGVSLGPIVDLGTPDGLLSLGGARINLLPLLMTGINVLASAIYLKGFPMKTKVQLYGIAAAFLVFLYKSPAGLVFYWTLNNLFSLAKNIFYKLKNPRKVLRILCACAGVLVAAAAFALPDGFNIKHRLFVLVVGLALMVPAILPLLLRVLPQRQSSEVPNGKLFTLGTVFLTVLVGLLIPSAYLASSPQEFIDMTQFHNPLWYLVSSLCYAGGTFLIWLRVFYWLASSKAKVVFDKLVWILCAVALVNYMFFGRDLGVISSTLQYVDGFGFSGKEQLVNLLVLAGLIPVLLWLVHRWKRGMAIVLLTAILALGGMSALNVASTARAVEWTREMAAEQQTDDTPQFTLSKTGQNVVVMMLDRAFGPYIPYLFNEKPELQAQFEGFTYYENTISFGRCTNIGVPVLSGGYEYTPVEMNRRSEEPLVDKHNEALLVMPRIFSENDFSVTVCDPVYANYSYVSDLSLYDAYPEIRAIRAEGSFTEPEQKADEITYNHRNFFCHSIMKIAPVCTQFIIYNGGRYNQASGGTWDYYTQATDGVSRATGMYSSFLRAYNVLAHLDDMTEITTEEEKTFLLMYNSTPHEIMLLQEPDYVPSKVVDNTQYDAENKDRFTLNGRTLASDNLTHMTHYQVNMAAMLQVGRWLDYLRANDVYDNTRIILVADHANVLRHNEDFAVDWEDEQVWIDAFCPLLMVKDFNSQEFTVSDEFMTNADVPTLALEAVVDNPVNPFTGKPINNLEKTAHDQIVTLTYDHNILLNNGNSYLPSAWASVKDNLWNKENWNFHLEETVLSEHVLP